MITILMVLAGLFLLNLVAMYFLQPRFTFPMPPAGSARPQALQEVHGEAIWSEVDGQRVEAWLLPGTGAGPSPVLIYTHGNGELIDYWADEFVPLRAAGIHILLVEYPGYGRSLGSPSESSVTAALVAAHDRVAADPRVDPRRIIGYGRSLGGGAIAQLAAKRPLAALVLESTFTSLTDIIRGYYVPDWLIRNRFDTRKVLQEFQGPVLLLHGQFDQVIPVAHAHALQAARPAAELHVLQCGHNNCPRQWELVLSFLTANGVCRGPDPEANHEESHTC
ncbi:MAG TPA: alpha/beta fold hydrolase [Steroidobacteraceae bacterium]|jgi:pimeloyl-ACP methyl ester carboxylesterase|nr:alpha/beta fold hydrolase [Steroidobacteraceae bacterium]